MAAPWAGLPVTDGLRKHTLGPTQQLLLWPLRTAGPGGFGACPPLSPQSHRAAHPPCSLCCLKDTGPSPPASRWDGECLFQEISVSSSSTRTLSFSIGVLATAEGILRGENRHTHLVDLMLAVPTGIWKPAPPWPAYPQAPGPPTHLRESLKAAPASDVMAWRWE